MREPSRIAGSLLAAVFLTAGALTAQIAAPSPEAAARQADLAELAAAIAADAELANALSTSSEGLVVDMQPDGSGVVDLQGRFQQLVIARLDAGGKLSVGHTVPFAIAPEPTGAEAVCRGVALETLELPGGGRASR